MGVSWKWWGPVHLLHPLSVWQSQVMPVIEALRWWWLGGGKMGGKNGRRGRWGGCLRAKGGCNRPVSRGGGCPAPLKMKEKKKGDDLSGAFLGALGTARVTAAGWLACACDVCEGGCNR